MITVSSLCARLDHLHLDPASHYPGIFIAAMTRLGDARLTPLALGAAAYCAVRWIEAYGLWFERAWAEGLAALSGAIYVPFEVRGILHGHGWSAAVALAINIAVVGIMVNALLRRRARRASGSPPSPRPGDR